MVRRVSLKSKMLRCALSFVLAFSLVGIMPGDYAQASGSGGDGQASVTAETYATFATAEASATSVTAETSTTTSTITSASSAASAASSASSVSTETFDIIETEEGASYIDGQIMVVYEEDVTAKQESAFVNSFEGEELTTAEFESGNVALLALDEGLSVEEACKKAEADPRVKYALPNIVLENYADSEETEVVLASSSEAVVQPFANGSNYLETDPYSTLQWYLQAVKAPEAWSLIDAYQGTITPTSVGVLDTGALLEHEDLQGVINRELSAELVWEFVEGKGYFYDNLPLRGDGYTNGSDEIGKDVGHGTHVTGIIAAEAGNGVGIVGVASAASTRYANKLASTCVVDTFSLQVGASLYDVLAAFAYSIKKKLRLVNMSLGFARSDISANTNDEAVLEAVRDEYVSLVKGKVAEAAQAGVIIVAAAGNANNTEECYPAACDEVISVINVDEKLNRGEKSTYGAWCDISAPGTNIYSTFYENTTCYKNLTGTSMAAPVVTGIAAMMLAVNFNLTAEEVRSILTSTATDIGAEGKDDQTGYGLVNAQAAVQEAIKSMTPSTETGKNEGGETDGNGTTTPGENNGGTGTTTPGENNGETGTTPPTDNTDGNGTTTPGENNGETGTTPPTDNNGESGTTTPGQNGNEDTTETPSTGNGEGADKENNGEGSGNGGGSDKEEGREEVAPEPEPEPAPVYAVISAPKASNKTYNGKQQTGVAVGTGYTVLNGSATKVGTYTAYVTPKAGYAWSSAGDQSTKKITWSISKCAISNSAVKIGNLAKSYVFNAKKITPALKITYNGMTLKQGTDYKLSYTNNYYAGTATVTITGIGSYSGTRKCTYKITAKTPTIAYRTYVQKKKWLAEVKNGARSGFVGKNLRVEGFKIRLVNQPYTGNVQVNARIQKTGWQGWKNGGQVAGKIGKSLRIETLKIRLTGNMAKYYDIYYRVRLQKFGYTGWAKNGQQCGSIGYNYRIEAVYVKIVPKGSKAPGSTKKTLYKK